MISHFITKIEKTVVTFLNNSNNKSLKKIKNNKIKTTKN
jgi:hypothetical protein